MSFTTPLRLRRIRPLAAAAAAFAIVAAVVAAGLTSPLAANAADGDAFDASKSYVFVVQGSPEQLYQSATDVDGTVKFAKLGGLASVAVNAIGYSTVDNYLYGIANTNLTTAAIPYGSLVRIGQGNVVTRVGTNVSGIGAKAGAIDGKYLYVFNSDQGGSEDPKKVVVFDTTDGSIANTFTLPSDPNVRDVAFAGGYAWAIDRTTGSPIRIDLLGSGHSVTTYSPLLPAGSYYGAAWTYGNGNLGFSNNDTGAVYQVAIANASSANPTFSLVSKVSGPASTLNDGAATPGTPTDLAITQTVSPSGFVAGETLTYQLTVTNNGAGESSGSVITENLPAGLTGVTTATPGCTVSGSKIVCVIGAIAAGANRTISISGTTTSSTASTITASATVLGNEADPVSSNNTASVGATLVHPALTLSKTVSPSTVTAVGQKVTYSFEVHNTGDVALSQVAVTETAFSGSGAAPAPVSCPTSIAAGGTFTCTSTYTATQADLDAGHVTNSANVRGTTPGGTTVTSATSSATVTEPAAAALSFAQSVSPSSITAAGQSVTYSYTVTNSGNVTVSNVGVQTTANGFSGTGTPSAMNCDAVPASGLASGASFSCTQTYVTTQADVDAGRILNTANAAGTAVGGATVTSPSASTQVTAAQTAQVAVTQTVSPTTFTAPGQTLTFSFVAKNTGNTTLTDVGIAPGTFTGAGSLSAVTCAQGSGSLAPGAPVDCSATYVTTQADVDAGSVSNTATAQATSTKNTAVTSSSASATSTATLMPALTLTQTVDPQTVADPNTPATYTFVVQNTGNTTVQNVAVTERAASFTGSGTLPVVTCPDSATSLAPGDSVTCTAPYTVTSDDIASGSVANVAIAQGVTPADDPVRSDSTSTVITTTAQPGLTLTSTVTPNAVQKARDQVTYTYTIANTGNVDVEGVSLVQAAATATNHIVSTDCDAAPVNIAVGKSVTCTATYTATQADIDAGRFTNRAMASGTYGTSNTSVMSPSASTAVAAAASPALTIVQTVDPSAITHVGQTLDYTFAVTNTGNVTETNVQATVKNTDFSGSGSLSAISCDASSSSMAPGDSVECTATYTVTQADVDAGSVTSTATATGTTPRSTTTTGQPSTATATATAAPALTLTQTVGPDTVSAAGQDVTFTYVVTNTGNVTVKSAGIDPTTFSGTGTLSAPSCDVTSLAPGDSATCTSTYVVSQADVDAGSIVNTATASGATIAGDAVRSASATAQVASTAVPELVLSRTATPTKVTAAGQVVSYTFTVTNTGTATATTLTATMAGFTGAGTAPTITCPKTTLAPGVSTACTATYTVLQADVERGSLFDATTAYATSPTGQPVTSNTVPAVIEATQTPALTIMQSASPAAVTTVGQQIAYTYTVTNSGNLAITNPGVSIGSFSGTGTPQSVVCDPSVTTLQPGDSVTCSATYTTTQADLDSGHIVTVASATGTAASAAPAAQAVTSSAGTTTVATNAAAQLALVHTVSPTSITAAGQQVTLRYSVTNTGGLTIKNVSVTEASFSGSGTAPVVTCDTGAASLAPGATVACTAVYTATQADVDAAKIVSIATAKGTTTLSVTVLSNAATGRVSALQAPSITLTQSASRGTIASAGQQVVYTFVATNTGDVTLHDVSVLPQTFSGTSALDSISCPSTASSVAPGASVTCTVTYTATQADVDSGAITLVDAASGHSSSGIVVTSTASSTSIPTATPALRLTQTVGPTTITAAGQKLVYRFVVTNSGARTVKGVSILEASFSGDSALTGLTCDSGAASLAPGESVSCTANYTVTQADVDAGGVKNIASAIGTGVGSSSTSPSAVGSTDTNTVVRAIQKPKLGVAQTVDDPRVTKVGAKLTYTYVVTNTGNVTMKNVSILPGTFSGTGAMSDITCPAAAASLAPGQSVTCTSIYTVTAADVKAGALKNVVSATGTSPAIMPVSADPTKTSVPLAATVMPTAAGAKPIAAHGLAYTGSQPVRPALVGLLLLLAGALALVVGRRKRPRYRRH